MSLVTRGLTDGTLITRGLGLSLFERIARWGADKYRKWIRGIELKKFLTIEIKGNNRIDFNITLDVLSNVSNPYQTIYKLFGNYARAINEQLSVKGNYQRELLFETRTSGKKSFFKLMMEILLDDED